MGLRRRADGRLEGTPAWAAATARHGIQKYTEEQTISVQRLLPLAPPPPMSQRLWVRLMTHALRLLRRVPGVR